MRVGLDLDDTLVKFVETFERYVVSRYPEMKEIVRNSVPSYDWFEAWGWNRDRFIIEMDIACDLKELFWVGELFEPDASHQVKRLRSAGHSIHIVTHRGYVSRGSDATHYWVNQNLGWVDSITLSGDKTSVPTDVFLEDNVSHYDALTDAGVNAFLINRPSNYQDDDRQRVDTFREFVDKILEES